MNYLIRFRHTLSAKLLLALVVTITLIGTILFTPLGNRLLSPAIEKGLSSAFSTPITLTKFSLTPEHFHLIARDNTDNTLTLQGGYSILTLRLYAHYRWECLEKKGMNPLAEPFKTEGAISGGISSLTLQGNARMFEGDLHYEGELRRFHLKEVALRLREIEYQRLMHFLEYPSDTDTKLSGSLHLEGLDRRDVTGEIHLTTLTTRFTPTPIVHDDTDTTMTLRDLLSDRFGRVKEFRADIRVDASFDHAGVLEQFVGVPLGGGLNIQGNVSGDEKLLKFKATSDAAQSETKLTVMITDLEPSSVSLDVRHADALNTFALFSLPSPIIGKLSGYAEFNATRGAMHVHITEGQTRPSILKKHYQFTQPLIRFNAEVSADLSNKGVRYRAAFRSNLTRMQFDATTMQGQMLRELLITLPSGSPHR
jgi:hypothetical protein